MTTEDLNLEWRYDSISAVAAFAPDHKIRRGNVGIIIRAGYVASCNRVTECEGTYFFGWVCTVARHAAVFHKSEHGSLVKAQRAAVKAILRAELLRASP